MATTKTKTPTRLLKETLRTPALFSRAFLKVVTVIETNGVKQMRIVPLIYRPEQERYLANRTSRDIILKPRQRGFSTAVQGELFRYAMTRRINALTLLDKDKNTKSFRRRQQLFYDAFPLRVNVGDDYFTRPDRVSDNDTEVVYSHTGSILGSGTAGALDVGRSNTYSHFHGSEVAFWKDPQAVVNGALQAGDPAWAVLESTANGAQGWFYEQCDLALRMPDKTVWALHFYEWFRFPELAVPLHPDESLTYNDDEMALIRKHGLTAEQIKWRRYKIKEISSLPDFLQEYPEDPVTCFQLSGNQFFTFLYDTFDTPRSEPDPSHIYMAGIDWGRDNDYTVCSIIDVHTNRMVALYRNRQVNYDIMRADIVDLLEKWGVKAVVPEANSAESNIEELIKDMKRKGLKCVVAPFKTSGISKMPMLSSLNKAIGEGLKLLDIPELQSEFRSVQKKQDANNNWVAVDNTGHTPDTVMATGLAVYAAMSVPTWKSRSV
jgi:hypothetical protein